MHPANCPQDAFISLTSPLRPSLSLLFPSGACARQSGPGLAVGNAVQLSMLFHIGGGGHDRKMERGRGRESREATTDPRPLAVRSLSLSHPCHVSLCSFFRRFPPRPSAQCTKSICRPRRPPPSASVGPTVARRGVCVWLASHPSLQVLTAQRNRTDAVGREQENHGKPEVRSSVERNLQAASSSWEDFSSLSVKLAGDAHAVRRPRSVTVARVRRPSLHIWQMAVRPGTGPA